MNYLKSCWYILSSLLIITVPSNAMHPEVVAPKPKPKLEKNFQTNKEGEISHQQAIMDAQKNVNNFTNSLTPEKSQASLNAYKKIVPTLQAEKYVQDINNAKKTNLSNSATDAASIVPKTTETLSLQLDQSISTPVELTSAVSLQTKAQENQRPLTDNLGLQIPTMPAAPAKLNVDSAINKMVVKYQKEINEGKDFLDIQAEIQNKIDTTPSATYKKSLEQTLEKLQQNNQTWYQTITTTVTQAAQPYLQQGLEIVQPYLEQGLEVSQPFVQKALEVKDTLSSTAQAATDVISSAASSVKKAALSTGKKAVDYGVGKQDLPELNITENQTRTTRATRKIAADGKIDNAELGVTIENKGKKAPLTAPAPKAYSTIDYIVSVVAQGAQKIMKTPQGVRKVVSQIIETTCRLSGYPPTQVAKIIDVEKYAQEGQEIAQQEPKQFQASFVKWSGKIMNDVYKALGVTQAKDLQTIRIAKDPHTSLPDQMQSPEVKITYNTADNTPRSLIVTYDGGSYNIDLQKITNAVEISKDNNNNTITILAPLYEKSQQRSAGFQNLIDTTLQGVRAIIQAISKYLDPQAQKVISAWTDFLFSKIIDPAAEGQILIKIAIDSTGNPVIQNKTITKLQNDTSTISVTPEMDGNTTLLTGALGNRFSAHIQFKQDTQRNVQNILMEHRLPITVNQKLVLAKIPPIEQSTIFNETTRTYITVAKFPKRAINGLKDFFKYAKDELSGMATGNVLTGSMESPGTQNLRETGPQAAKALNETQALIESPAESYIEYVLMTNQVESQKTVTYTINVMLDNSRQVTRVAYPIDENISQAGSTLPLPKETTNIDIATLESMFEKHAESYQQEQNIIASGKRQIVDLAPPSFAKNPITKR